MAVTRCICHDITFAELLELRDRTGADFDQLTEMTGAGTSCGMCREYIRTALRTGRTSLPLLSNKELRQLADQECAG